MPKDPEAPAAPDPQTAESGDEEQDEDEPEQGEREEQRAREPEPERRAAGRSKRAPRSAPPRDERQIDSPTRQTVGMLTVASFATLIMWAAARGACNDHPPENRKPRAMPIAELAREPKDAAIEMQQRWSTFDFGAALELAKGPVADAIRQAQLGCEASPGECQRKRAQFSDDKVFTVGELLSREGTAASVRVTVRGGEAGTRSFLVGVERDGNLWKAVSHRDAPAELPRPAPPAAPAPSAPPAQATGSAAPPASAR